MTQEEKKLHSVYCRLYVLRLDDVTQAENAIRRRDHNEYLDAMYQFDRVNRIIKAEFPEYDEFTFTLLKDARENDATFPDWPYACPFDEEMPAFVLSAADDNCDVPF